LISVFTWRKPVAPACDRPAESARAFRSGRQWLRHCALAACVGWASALCSPAETDGPPTRHRPTEYEQKAGIILNVARNLEWPAEAFADADSPVRFCILGDDPFGPALDKRLARRTVRGRPVTVERHRRVQDIRECHILFVSGSEQQQLSAILAEVSGRSLLTAGDTEDFLQRGGALRLDRVAQQVGFELDENAVRRAGLKIGSRLMRILRQRQPPLSGP
jgi:hypothetical protein